MASFMMAFRKQGQLILPDTTTPDQRICPHCGEKLQANRLSELLETLKPTGQELRVLSEMERRFGHPVSKERLIEILYSDHRDGGPEHAEDTVRQFLYRIRKKLRENSTLNLSIATVYGHGYALQHDEKPRTKNGI